MGRVGIYIGNQEVVERYVGDKFVWKKLDEDIVAVFTGYYFYSENYSSKKVVIVTKGLYSVIPGIYSPAFLEYNGKKYTLATAQVYKSDNKLAVLITFNTLTEKLNFKNSFHDMTDYVNMRIYRRR